MCRICKQITGMTIGDALNVIGEALLDPTLDRRHLDKITDELMEANKPSDEDEEAAHEYYRRLQGEDT